ncbi:MAG: hypothetical protein GX556_02875 [Fibrobacter sp.]|nr:hypothetical protein [Fibrobacter sp.]
MNTKIYSYRILFVAFLLSQVLISCNPFFPKESDDGASISIISTNHQNDSKVASSDTLIAKIRVELSDMDTSGSKRYYFTMSFNNGDNSFSTSIVHGAFSINSIVDTIDVQYPFSSDFDKNTNSTLKYSLRVETGASLLHQRRILASMSLSYGKE